MKQRTEEAVESLACTASRCRKNVDPGQGIQWLNEKGEIERYCWGHYKKMIAEEEKLNRATERGEGG